MPIPKPNPNEKQKDFMIRCVPMLTPYHKKNENQLFVLVRVARHELPGPEGRTDDTEAKRPVSKSRPEKIASS